MHIPPRNAMQALASRTLSQLDGQRPFTYSVDTIAGGGKTYAAIEHAARRAGLGGKTIIAQPSTALIEQTHADLTAGCRREGGGIVWRRSLRFVATSQSGVGTPVETTPWSRIA